LLTNAFCIRIGAIDEIFNLGKATALNCALDMDVKLLQLFQTWGSKHNPFTLSGFDEALVRSGGWGEFADARY
jgi:hypothetical protein